MQISKTDFIQFLNCPKSLWLLKHRPDEYPHDEFSDYAQKIAAEGYEVEDQVQAYLTAQDDAKRYEFQSEFHTERELYAKADVIRHNDDESFNIYEVKSSTQVKTDAAHNQLKDAVFQKITAEEAGCRVAKVFIVHLNPDYVRQGNPDPSQLLAFEDVSERVAAIEDETRAEIDDAVDLLNQGSIDETSCSCLGLTRSNHCDAFNHFNPDIPDPSIYSLPRVTKKRLSGFVADGRFGLDQIGEEEVTAGQLPVLRAAQKGTPIIDKAVLQAFFARAKYPLYFLDYETYSSAIPLVDGAKPQAPIPFQYSLHVKKTPDDADPEHFEFLAPTASLPLAMIEHMERIIGAVGSVVSWHSSFENTQNRTMAEWYPEKAKFLNNLVDRTLDLEDLFKAGYVDIAFGGSTSIKKVLPIIVPDLSYDDMEVANGTDAMEAWSQLLDLPDGPEKDKLRQDMLEYCKLDTLAMVRIFDEIAKL
ncbi:DUF2779 domain-containing protein [Sulfitobacter mediterraneus]|uniref:DUF2779 domain-containing protein n=1 Tax=Sulfitobacter mediterraneus TaxID=83219 RepID=UPI00248F633A|nr:DUF2779 domain-containing protein [Sulfitobacter mediterraneus]